MLSKQLHVPWFPTDYMEAVVSQYIPDNDTQEPYPLTNLRHTTHKSNDRFYADFSAEKIIAMYRGKAKMTWPGLRAFIEYAAYEHRSFILEGLHIDPVLLHDLPSNTQSFIKYVFLYRVNENEIEKGFANSTEKHDWVLEHTKNPETFAKIAAMIQGYGVLIRDDAEQEKLPAICMDGNFNALLKQAVDFLAQ